MRNIPNLFVLGAPKAGTTSFVSSLKQHPAIFVPEVKEPRFFDASVYYDFKEDYLTTTADEYLQHYDSPDSKNSIYRTDGSVFNMYSMDAINDILSTSPDAKFIIILRDPLTAVKSMFSQRMKYSTPQLREVHEDFEVCWQLSKERKEGKNFPNGCRNKFLFRYDLLYAYEKYLPTIIERIPEGNLLVTSYSDFLSHPDQFYSHVFHFLNIDEQAKISNKKENQSFYTPSTFVSRLLGVIAFKTLKIRKALGLTGPQLPKLKRLLLGRKTSLPEISHGSDEDIKQFFKSTYKYLREIGVKV